MNDNISRISQAELEVMKILWQEDGPVSTGTIYNKLSDQLGWDRSTVRTLLKRLAEKEAVAEKKLEVLCYLPLISEKEYRSVQTRSLVKRLYGGSAKRLVTSLMEDYELSAEDIKELRDFLNSGGGKHE